jgi:hypothetical protein
MKVRPLLFLMLIWAASVDGTLYAAGLSQRTEFPSSASHEENGPDRPRDATKGLQVRGQRDQRDGRYLEEHPNAPRERTMSPDKRRPSKGRHPQAPANDPVRFGNAQDSHNSQMAAHGTGMDSPRTISPSAAVPDSVFKRSGGSVRPPVTAALNGHEFKKAHNAPVNPAVSGGPAKSISSTAAINGTEMKHKP